MMKKVVPIIVCFFLCFVVALAPVKSFGGHDDRCWDCHWIESVIDRHGDDIAFKASSCATCHPQGNEGKCNLANLHGRECLRCHTECVVDPSTTTTVPCSGGHFDCYCLQCHYEGTEKNRHEKVGIEVELDASACVTCHPQGNPGKCNLVDNHPSWCLNCHTECVESLTTTTVGKDPTTTVPPANHIETCTMCHNSDDLHDKAGHSSCAMCHDGTPGSGNVEPGTCINCHPAGNAGKCNLVEEHGSSCYSCHFECEDATTTGPIITTTTAAPTEHMDTCTMCHNSDDLHDKAGHSSSCSICHDGTPQSGNVEPDACVVCHPTGSAGKCNLVNLHGSSCLSCHFECEGGGDTTTSTPGSTTATNPICPQEKIYGEHSDEVALLRYFRDNVLSTTAEGREIIKLYYQLSPVIVAAMENDGEFKEEVREIMDQILPIVRIGLE